VVEHVFVGEVLRTLWRRGIRDVEVLRSEFDAFGYDLVLAHGDTVRYVQLKTANIRSGTTGRERKPRRVQVNLALTHKRGACVIWIGLDADLNLGPFYWFGGAPAEHLPALDGARQPRKLRRTKSGERARRANHRVVPYKSFVRCDSLQDIIGRLFPDA
jgi:hypothetical protein